MIDLKKHPAPWTLERGYEQADPGFYIVDASGLVVIAACDGNGQERGVLQYLVDSANSLNSSGAISLSVEFELQHFKPIKEIQFAGVVRDVEITGTISEKGKNQ